MTQVATQIVFVGENIQIDEEPFEVKYKRVLSSSRWKKLKLEAMKEFGEVCWSCGISKYSRKLELHHINYKNLGKETLDDVSLLCDKCHRKEDAKREMRTNARQSANAFNNLFRKAWETRENNILDDAEEYGLFVHDSILEIKKLEFRHWLFCKYFDIHYIGMLPKVIDEYFICDLFYGDQP